jgi:PIN domain nuclease of toxin-antitoxin system
VSFLLDTHSLIWWLVGDPQLSGKAKNLIESQSQECFVSSVSAYEIGIKVQSGKMEFARNIWNNLPSIIEGNSFQNLSVNFEHALLAPKLPTDHRDPFDRLLAAQAIVERMELITIDARLKDLGAKVVW